MENSYYVILFIALQLQDYSMKYISSLFNLIFSIPNVSFRVTLMCLKNTKISLILSSVFSLNVRTLF